MKVTFYGAAQTVTGSRFLVHSKESTVLVDCGLFQGPRKNREKNWTPPPFNLDSLDAVILTHAHIDHTGYLPRLVKDGFRGPVFCSSATKELLGLLLPDSAHLQEEEARYANLHGTSRHKPALPLYNGDDAEEALKLLQVIPRSKEVALTKDLNAFLTCAGHILGSNSISLYDTSNRITFSGDLGRYDTPILPDPEPHELGNLLVCESTYGDRLHNQMDMKLALAAILSRAIERKGPIIIPAFALGRTQTLLYTLASLEREGLMPELPVFIDSPMAVDATEIYRRYAHDYDSEAQMILRSGEYPLKTAQTVFCRSTAESKRLNGLTGTRIIISASGMVTGGRILHHMKHHLPDPAATVIFVGYQAEGTRGATIQSGKDVVKIFGEHVPIRAKIETISGMSAHGDKNELLRWLRSCSGTPKQVKIVHGEPSASASFARTLQEELGWEASVAQFGERVEV